MNGTERRELLIAILTKWALEAPRGELQRRLADRNEMLASIGIRGRDITYETEQKVICRSYTDHETICAIRGKKVKLIGIRNPHGEDISFRR